jgi:glyoxylase-like metal-dependent hydrolase (beta-lactamase superfamily II)
MERDVRLNIAHWFDAATGSLSYVVDDGEGSCAVIDSVLDYDPVSGRTGTTGLEPLVQSLRDHGGRLQWLLETHIHADHLSAAQVLRQAFGGQVAAGCGVREVFAHFARVFHWEDTEATAFDRLFSDGETFAIGALRARVLHVPGHTPADVAYLVDDPQGGPSALFVGDTLFAPDLGTARCDFPGGDAATLYRSIRRLMELPADTRVYLCHDYPPSTRPPRHQSTVAEQRAANIHMREGIELAQFCALRRQRDATLSLPRLVLPAVQFNLMAGQAPHASADGVPYLRIPLNVF